MQKTVNVITPPVKYPVEPDEAMTWLKWDPSNLSDAQLIDEVIATATQMIEYYTARAIMTQTLEMHFVPEPTVEVIAGQLYSGYDSLPSTIKLWRPPLVSVASTGIKAVEENGTEHVQAATKYYVNTSSSNVGKIVLLSGSSWDYYPNGSYKIQYVAGYGATVDKVPPPIRHAIKLMVSQLYGTRERGDITLTPEIKTVLDELRIREWELTD